MAIAKLGEGRPRIFTRYRRNYSFILRQLRTVTHTLPPPFVRLSLPMAFSQPPPPRACNFREKVISRPPLPALNSSVTFQTRIKRIVLCKKEFTEIRDCRGGTGSYPPSGRKQLARDAILLTLNTRRERTTEISYYTKGCSQIRGAWRCDVNGLASRGF